jgi:uncharacterized membrane protein (UPF0136 family)
MHDFKYMVLWIYIFLLLAGGLIGFYKAQSKVSLISSAVFAALLAVLAVPGIFERKFAHGAANVLLAALLVVFAIRLVKTKKFMPSGLMLVVTTLMLVLLNLFKSSGAG